VSSINRRTSNFFLFPIAEILRNKRIEHVKIRVRVIDLYLEFTSFIYKYITTSLVLQKTKNNGIFFHEANWLGFSYIRKNKQAIYKIPYEEEIA
jgi:hypothetical protein